MNKKENRKIDYVEDVFVETNGERYVQLIDNQVLLYVSPETLWNIRHIRKGEYIAPEDDDSITQFYIQKDVSICFIVDPKNKRE